MFTDKGLEFRVRVLGFRVWLKGSIVFLTYLF